MWRNWATLSGLLLCLASNPVWADFDKGNAAYYAGDYETAHKELLEGAKMDDGRCQYLLGVMYAKGEGVSPDLVEAHKWLSLASRHKGTTSLQARSVRRQVAAAMSSGQIVEAKRLADTWKAESN